MALALVGARAGTPETRAAFDRLDEVLSVRLDDGSLSARDLTPAILVSAKPLWESSDGWFQTRAIEAAQRVVGPGALRVCEACMTPRADVSGGSMVVTSGTIGLDEITRFDEQVRGSALPARAALWIDEHRGGVSIRIVDLRNGAVLFAQNVDPERVENRNTRRMYTLAEEYDRRARGDSLTQGFADFALYPGQHISLDWTDQWGKTNANLSGVTISLLDPFAGIGACHYRRVPLYDVLVGGKLVLSLPTALVRSFGEDAGEVIDPLVSVVGVVRVPFGRSNYGAVLTASTNGRIGIGISLMNVSLLPVIP